MDYTSSQTDCPDSKVLQYYLINMYTEMWIISLAFTRLSRKSKNYFYYASIGLLSFGTLFCTFFRCWWCYVTMHALRYPWRKWCEGGRNEYDAEWTAYAYVRNAKINRKLVLAGDNVECSEATVHIQYSKNIL